MHIREQVLLHLHIWSLDSVGIFLTYIHTRFKGKLKPCHRQLDSAASHYIINILHHTHAARRRGSSCWLRRRYTVRFARTESADCPLHGPIAACDMSLECPGHVKIGWKGFTARSIFEPILPPELGDYPIRAQQTPKTTFTLYDCERETGSVSHCT